MRYLLNTSYRIKIQSANVFTTLEDGSQDVCGVIPCPSCATCRRYNQKNIPCALPRWARFFHRTSTFFCGSHQDFQKNGGIK